MSTELIFIVGFLCGQAAVIAVELIARRVLRNLHRKPLNPSQTISLRRASSRNEQTVSP
jgi:hypothetical protein